MSPWGFLPFVAFASLFLAIRQTGRDDGISFVEAALGWGTYAVLGAEALSLFEAVTPSALLILWGLPTLGLMFLVLRAWRRGRPLLPQLQLPRSPVARAAAAGLAVILILTAVVAWLAPPNTWDALTYHMTRVAHWAQDGKVAHYASGNEHQNYMPPGGSILALHVYVLGQGDRLVNFVQWFAMLGCLIVAGILARRFGAGEKGRWLSAVFVATLPVGILEATATMTDYIVTLWVAIAALSAIQLWQGERKPEVVLSLGASAGLAVVTKQTAVAYLAPFAALLLVVFIRNRAALGPMRWIGLALLLIGLLDVGHLYRNWSTYGNFAGPERRVEVQANQFLDGRVLVSNLIRNLSHNAGTPSPHVNKAIALAVRQVHEWMGLDENDPRTTANGTFRVKPPSFHETTGSNPVHAYLLAAVVPLGWLWRRRLPRSLLTYAILLAVSLILLSATLQWRPTGNRFQLALFVLAAPIAAMVLEAAASTAAVGGAVAGLLLTSIPWLIGNQSRPLISGWPEADVGSVLVVPRDDLLFANAPYVAQPYREMVSLIGDAECKEIGIALPGGGLEYPLWSLLGAPRGWLDIEWLVAGTASAKYVDPAFAPCAVVCEKCPSSWVTVRGLPEAYRHGAFRLYMAAPASSQP